MQTDYRHSTTHRSALAIDNPTFFVDGCTVLCAPEIGRWVVYLARGAHGSQPSGQGKGINATAVCIGAAGVMGAAGDG